MSAVFEIRWLPVALVSIVFILLSVVPAAGGVDARVVGATTSPLISACAPGTATTTTPTGATCWTSALPVTGTPSCSSPPNSTTTEVTETFYDTQGQKVAVTGPLGTPYSWNGTTWVGCNPLASSTCTDTTYYAYDQAGRQVSVTSPPDGGGSTRTTTSYYDQSGNQVAVTGPSGNPSTCNPLTTSSCAGTVYNTFDGAGRLTGTSYTDGTAPVTTTYNADGTKASVVQGTGSGATTTTSTYNALGQLTKVVNGAGATVTYAYDTNGNLVCLGYPVATQACSATTSADLGVTGLVVYTYDAADQMATMTDWVGDTLSFTYDLSGDLCATTTATTMSSCSSSVPSGGVTTLNTMNDAGQLSTSTTTHGSTGLLSFTNSWDGNGNLASSTPSVNGTAGSADTYGYDQLTRVTAGSTWSGSSGGTTLAYTQDGGITRASGFISASYAGNGELCWTATASGTACTSPPSGATTYTYNATGERTAVGSTWSGGWAPEAGNLCWSYSGSSTNSCSAAPSGATSYSYDPNGLRATEAGTGISETFTWDLPSSRLLQDSQFDYLYGPRGAAPIEQIALGTSPAVVDLLIADASSNIRGLVRIGSTTAANTLTGYSDLDTYGRPISGAGGATEPGGLTTPQTGINSNFLDQTPFEFGGGYMDPSGLVYLVNRYYDPIVGQYTSIDLMLPSTGTPYGYGNDNPESFNDPNGLSARKPVLATAAQGTLAVKFAKQQLNLRTPYYYGAKQNNRFPFSNKRMLFCSGNGVNSNWGTVMEGDGERARCNASRWSVNGTQAHPARGAPQPGFDCSGLTQWAWGSALKSNHINLNIGLDTWDQYYRSAPVAVPRPGDLVLYYAGGETNGHVAIYIGNGRVIQEYCTGSTASEDDVNERGAWNNGDKDSMKPIHVTSYRRPILPS